VPWTRFEPSTLKHTSDAEKLIHQNFLEAVLFNLMNNKKWIIYELTKYICTSFKVSPVHTAPHLL